VSARAAIALGANVGDPVRTLERAIAALANAAGTIIARSSFYRTPAWGIEEQPDFVNAAVIVETTLAPVALLAAIKRIESDLGRVPTYRWGPRAIDLDILTYDDIELSTEKLTIPHPRMRERAFVLIPLAEIDATWRPALATLTAQDVAGVVCLT